jgi:hypothetical protein
VTRTTVPLFAATLFVGSFLMFAVEPMAARQMLPVLGGTPMVWNGCVVFFQAALLLGYGSAHVLTHWVGPRLRLLVYGALALLPLPLLNLRVDAGSAVGAETAPLGWLLVSLLSTVGPPFLVLAVCSSVVQSALASSSHKSAKDPYFLYVASNAGSLAALIAYPTVIEPWLGLTQQAGAWKIAYGGFVALVLVCAALALFVLTPRADDRAAVSDGGDASSDEPIRFADRARWCALAAVPSSLMLGVTTALTTDIAPIPLLWVVPLALYLLTFIVAFSRVGTGATALGSRLLPVLLLVLAFLLLLRLELPVGPGLLIHLVPFGVAAMVCHGRLAETRPSPRRLTEFYFWLALGGMLGGLFNTLLAPALFSSLVEYPIALVLVAALRPIKSDDGFRWSKDIWLPLLAVVVVAALSYLGWDRSHLVYVLGVIAFLVTLTFAQRNRRWAYAGVVGVMLLATGSISLNAAPTLHRVRTFFGTYAVHADDKQHHVLSHGTTMHGMQALDAVRRTEPLTYYHRTGPFGQMMASVPRLREPGRFAGIGLGVGSLATYRQPGQKWTFFEIDAAMEEIARDERLFTFLPQCGPACEVVLGDARLTLGRQHEQYELIALDAFTSDAIPLHLLTNEAMRVYLAKLASHGVLAVHISNRHLELAPIVARLAAANGLIALHRVDRPGGTQWPDGKSSSQWVVMARSAADLGSLTTSSQWVAPQVQPSTPLWTDDFTNLLTVMHFASN